MLVKALTIAIASFFVVIGIAWMLRDDDDSITSEILKGVVAALIGAEFIWVAVETWICKGV